MSLQLHRLSDAEEDVVRMMRKMGDPKAQQIVHICRYACGEEVKPQEPEKSTVVPIRPVA